MCSNTVKYQHHYDKSKIIFYLVDKNRIGILIPVDFLNPFDF